MFASLLFMLSALVGSRCPKMLLVYFLSLKRKVSQSQDKEAGTFIYKMMYQSNITFFKYEEYLLDMIRVRCINQIFSSFSTYFVHH